MKILIDLVYINSPGGITLSKLLMDYILENKIESNVELLFDKRNFDLFNNHNLTKTTILKSEIARYFFYKKKHRKIQISFMLCKRSSSI